MRFLHQAKVEALGVGSTPLALPAAGTQFYRGCGLSVTVSGEAVAGWIAEQRRNPAASDLSIDRWERSRSTRHGYSQSPEKVA